VDASFEAFLQQLEGPAYDETIAGYWTGILEGATDAVRQQVLSDLRATPKSTVIGSMRAMAGFDAQAALAQYRRPMLTVTTPLNDFPSSLQNVVKNLRHERVNAVSHWLHLDRPDAFNAILDRFLAEAQK
jgi:pimeloyl-ACP methyl ester carboxylesterase